MRQIPSQLAARAAVAVIVLAGALPAAGGDGMPPPCATQASCSGTALRIVPETPRSGEPALLEFTFTDATARPLEDLLTHHARKVHVVIVDERLEVLGHVHPRDFGEPVDDGSGRVYFTFPRPGRYLIATDALSGRGPLSARFLVDVSGPAPVPATAAAPAHLRVVPIQPHDRHVEAVRFDGPGSAAGYAVELHEPESISPGQPTRLRFRFSRDGAALAELRPFLAAPMHLAVVKDDLGQFLHEHGSVPGAEGDGHHRHGGHAARAEDHEGRRGRAAEAAEQRAHQGHAGHHAHGSAPPTTFGPEVTATVDFPEPGRYVLFGQAAAGGDLLNFRFPVTVD